MNGAKRRRLIVVRHAKAEPYAETDHERPLTARGHEDAAEVGTWLAAEGFAPDVAVVSSALRTRETWAEVAAAAHADPVVDVDEALYNGSPDVVLQALRLVDPDAGTVVFVGHNPTAAYLAHQLDDGQGEPAALEEMFQGFPTSAVAVFELDVAWSDLADGTGRLTAFHVGRT